MKIKTSYPGQEEKVIDAPANIVRMYEKDGTFPPYVELYVEEQKVVLLDETSFKSTYVATFLASYSAVHYNENCMNGHRGDPHKNQPIEDAIYNSECAWETYRKIYNV